MAKKQTRKRSTARKSARPAARRKTTGARAATRSTRARTGAAGRREATGRTTTRARGQARGRSSRRGGQLGRSTLHAKWIDSAADRSTRPGETLATRSHGVIQQWAEERGAEPATIASNDPESPRVLRLNFPGFGGKSLQPVRWDDWLRTFDDRDLVFLFQDRMKSGRQSNFFRLDNPNREDA